MTAEEKKRLSVVLRATEYLFLENLALKLVLEHRQVSNWQKLLDHLVSDEEMMGGVRLKFSDLYRDLEIIQRSVIRTQRFLGRTSSGEEAALAPHTPVPTRVPFGIFALVLFRFAIHLSARRSTTI